MQTMAKRKESKKTRQDKTSKVRKKPRANFNHFVLMESTRSVFKQLVQSGRTHPFLISCVFVFFAHFCVYLFRFASIQPASEATISDSGKHKK